MQFTFLGTSSGVPTRGRNVSALALRAEQGKSWVLIDCGEGTQQQLQRTRYSLLTLAAICITHVHGDHCYGLPGLLASAAMAGRREPLLLIAPAPIAALLEAVRACSDLHLPYALNFQAVDAEQYLWQTEDFQVQAIALSHRVPCYAYQFTETASCFGLDTARLQAEGIAPGVLWRRLQLGDDVLLEDGVCLRAADYRVQTRTPRSVIVAGDNDDPALLRAACSTAQVLIHEATYTEDIAAKVGPEPQHSTAARVARFAAAVGLQHLLLTHFSPRYQDDELRSPSIQDVAAEAAAHFQGSLYLARDFDSYALGRDLNLARVDAAV